jgi:replicative DNA helicase
MKEPNTNKNLRIPPQSLESEMAILGALLQRPDSIYDVSDVLTPAAFYSSRNRIIYDTILNLNRKGAPIDSVSVLDYLKDQGLIERSGGAAYLAELIDFVPSTANIGHYSTTIQKKKIMRDLLEAADHISGLGFDESKELEEILDTAEKKIFEVTNMTTSTNIIALKNVVGAAFERLERIHATKDAIRGVPTGFKALDNKLSGFQKSDLIILAARPAVGKTSLVLDMARRAALNHKIPVQVFSLEMGADQLVDRMVSAESEVDLWSIRTGKNLKESDFEAIGGAISRLSDAPIFINDEAGINLMKMRSVCRRVKSEHGLGLVIVDYLQLMTPMTKSDNTVAQVTEISRGLKQLAREMDVPVIALSQLSRAVESRGGKPRLSDLRDSGSIEQDADIVMFIHREDKYNPETDKPNIAEIMIEKHRNGPVGICELFFDSKKTKYLDIETGNYGNDLDNF